MDKRISFYEEEIVIKPSTELIPDEYEHTTNKNVNVHIFKNVDVVNNRYTKVFVDTLSAIEYNVGESKIHNIAKLDLNNTLQEIQAESENSEALLLIFNCLSKIKGQLFLGEGSHYDIQKIWNMFTTKNCKGLKNKPKVFIFNITEIQDVQRDGLRHFTAPFEATYDTPSEADILVIYHTSKDTKNESFVEGLCQNIKEHGKTEDLITLASIVDVDQRPLIVSTLTRKFYTTISENRGHHLIINENTDDLINILTNLNQRLKQLEAQSEKKEKQPWKLSNLFRHSSLKEEKNKESVKRRESVKEEKKKEKVKRAESLNIDRNAKKEQKKLTVEKKETKVDNARRRLSSTSSSRRPSVVVVDKKPPPWK